jgi:hypothetical protein
VGAQVRARAGRVRVASLLAAAAEGCAGPDGGARGGCDAESACVSGSAQSAAAATG